MIISANEKQLNGTINQTDKEIYSELCDITDFKFITLTYDPKKFGYSNSENIQKEYFLAKIYPYIKDKQFYGCFEHHQNGNLHMHFILKETEEYCKIMKKEIRRYFTDDTRNRSFMDIGTAKYKLAIRYINKEEEMKKSWYQTECTYLEELKEIKTDNIKHRNVQVTKPVNGGTQGFCTEFATPVANLQGEGSHTYYCINNWVKKHLEIYNFINKYLRK